ncbi:MAG: hypothetical protein A2015_06100 [Spirochaetes bacterium GWF1_31_7]|nr:MAG: hypothetical protein A2Y30_07610 [Spirochaetes bacterium GWE1_32_154]OHD50826.1 MAG: hypothetical protein A2Y29_02730 [Spirochaetes bacterium GWE2_31_10]OHD52764.1 MAG: hypothetical protein A2015_06100 [Spirochaetes bacterium GWF1_31_7]OHD81707.1 MAG: hypothetical protein A2355_07585 [Spirochaetes bacterium RIFOXYB1_FULL_32_8]HBD95442.1 heat-shock protein [Spirochaetia bacterium]
MNFLNKKENEYRNVESKRGLDYYKPATDIVENEANYTIIFDMPGIDKNDISLKVEKGVLTVTAESNRKPDLDYTCIREEFEYTGYRRSFNLNDVIDVNSINAEYKDGTLILSLPKKEEQKTREIEIKIG